MEGYRDIALFDEETRRLANFVIRKVGKAKDTVGTVTRVDINTRDLKITARVEFISGQFSKILEGEISRDEFVGVIAHRQC